MANFCVKCGAPLSNGPFCVTCGADARHGGQTVAGQSAPPPAASANTPASAAPIANDSTQPAAAKSGMSPLLKLGIAALAIIFVGGIAGAMGLYYVAHKVTQKYHQVSDGILGSSSSSHATSSSAKSDRTKGSASDGSSLGDVCRLLSKEAVSRAIGVPIVRAEPGDNGCSYIAKGTQAEMTAKHMKAMAGAEGASKEAQDVVEKFAGGMGKMFAAEAPASEQDTSGEVPVFTFSVDQNAAEQQLRLNAKVLSNLGPQQGIPGIGDQAFVSADGMMFVRKGKSLVRILYLSCPCGTEQVKPLAKTIADALGKLGNAG